MRSAPITLRVPDLDSVSNKEGLLNRAWHEFFHLVRNRLDPLGYEKSANLENNISTPQDVLGLSVDSKKISAASFEFLIQRVTTGTGAVEFVEYGEFRLHFLPTSNTWVLSNGPTTSGVTLTVTASGQVQFETDNKTGTASIFKITWRGKSLSAKNYQYSEVGR